MTRDRCWCGHFRQDHRGDEDDDRCARCRCLRFRLKDDDGIEPQELPQAARRHLPTTIEGYKMGSFSILVGPESAEGETRWHMSMAHPNRLPSWDELKRARRALLPDDLWLCLPWPPEDYWLNLHDNCLHLWEVRDPWLIEQMKVDGSGLGPT